MLQQIKNLLMSGLGIVLEESGMEKRMGTSGGFSLDTRTTLPRLNPVSSGNRAGDRGGFEGGNTPIVNIAVDGASALAGADSNYTAVSGLLSNLSVSSANGTNTASKSVSSHSSPNLSQNGYSTQNMNTGFNASNTGFSNTGSVSLNGYSSNGYNGLTDSDTFSPTTSNLTRVSSLGKLQSNYSFNSLNLHTLQESQSSESNFNQKFTDDNFSDYDRPNRLDSNSQFPSENISLNDYTLYDITPQLDYNNYELDSPLMKQSFFETSLTSSEEKPLKLKALRKTIRKISLSSGSNNNSNSNSTFTPLSHTSSSNSLFTSFNNNNNNVNSQPFNPSPEKKSDFSFLKNFNQKSVDEFKSLLKNPKTDNLNSPLKERNYDLSTTGKYEVSGRIDTSKSYESSRYDKQDSNQNLEFVARNNKFDLRDHDILKFDSINSSRHNGSESSKNVGSESSRNDLDFFSINRNRSVSSSSKNQSLSGSISKNLSSNSLIMKNHSPSESLSTNNSSLQPVTPISNPIITISENLSLPKKSILNIEQSYFDNIGCNNKINDFDDFNNPQDLINYSQFLVNQKTNIILAFNIAEKKLLDSGWCSNHDFNNLHLQQDCLVSQIDTKLLLIEEKLNREHGVSSLS